MLERWRLDPTSQRLALELLRYGPLPRSVLTSRLALSSASLTRLTKPLIGAGVLVEGEPDPTARAGRPSLPLDVVAASAMFLGIKVVPGRLYAVRTTLKGDVVDSVVVDGDWVSAPEQAVAAIAALAARWPDRLAGVGVCLGATVGRNRLLAHAFALGWGPVDLGTLVTKATGLPCRVENDGNALALAEHWFGHGRHCRDFAVVTLGSGVGLGFVSNDVLVSGASGAAGMVGVLRLDDGRRAADVVTTGSVLRSLSSALGRELTEDDIPAAASRPEGAAVLDEVAEALGQVVGQCRAVLDPERVLVGGEGAEWLIGRESLVRSGAAKYQSADHAALPINVAVIGFSEWARGAAAIAIRDHMSVSREP